MTWDDLRVSESLLSADQELRLRRAIALAHLCPPSSTAFSVGATIVAADGTVLAEGFSREEHPHEHAEEAALRKVDPDDPRLATAVLYSSLEPCSKRASRPVSCTEWILRSGIGAVVFAWREPSLFVDCEGAELLRAGGVQVVEAPEYADLAKRTNAHLLGGN